MAIKQEIKLDWGIMNLARKLNVYIFDEKPEWRDLAEVPYQDKIDYMIELANRLYKN